MSSFDSWQNELFLLVMNKQGKNCLLSLLIFLFLFPKIIGCKYDFQLHTKELVSTKNMTVVE